VSNPNPEANWKGKRQIGGPGRPKGSKNKITRETWDAEVRYLAHSNIIDAFTAVHGNKRSFTLRELRAMPERMQRAISSVKVRTENLTSGDGETDTTIEIKLWDKTRALELGARANGWLKDKVEVTLPEEQLSRLDRAKERSRKGE
jgi:hypothetical protein